MTEERLLEILRKSSEFISGEHISNVLGVTRTAIWKAVNRLRNRGFRIDSVTNKGYKLTDESDPIDRVNSGTACNTVMIGRKVKYTSQCTSTNDKAREGGNGGDDEGTVYLTDYQTNGRGRLGRTWHGEPGQSIYMSILLKPDVSPLFIMPVSLMAGLAVCNALEKVCNINCFLKWPNDIISDKKKIGGILIETSTLAESIQYITLGIGINCNISEFPVDLADKATSVLIRTGEQVQRRNLICAVLQEFEQLYFRWVSEFDDSSDEINASKEFSFLLDYRSKCLNIGKPVVINKGSDTINGDAVNVSPQGYLLVRLDSGKIVPVLSGEVSIRGISGYV